MNKLGTIFFIVILCTFLTQNIFAQDDIDDSEVNQDNSSGLTIEESVPPSGYAISTELMLGLSFTGNSDNNTNFKESFFVEANGFFDFSTFFSIGLGFIYKRYRVDHPPHAIASLATQEYLTITLETIGVPILFSAKFPFYPIFEDTVMDFLAPLSFVLKFGPGINFIVDAYYTNYEIVEVDASENFKLFYFSFNFNVGFEYSLPYGYVMLGYQVTTSIGTVIDDSVSTVLQDVRLEEARLLDHNIWLGYGYKFSL